MKEVLTPKLLRRVLILSFLILGLVFVVSNNRVVEPVGAWICCSACPVVPGSEVSPYDYCAAQCGSNSGGCYDACLQDVWFCWQHCNICDGTGCSYDSDCFAGGYCIGGLCQY